MLGLLLALPAVALALPTTATLTGTVLGSNNDPCASCQVTIRTPFDQEVDGGTFPAEPIGTIYTTDADGEMPAGATATRGLWVEITVQYGTPNLAQIPDASTVDISTLILEPPTETPTSYVTDVWTCLSGNCNALTAATGDTLNATAADTTAPCKSGTTAPATCSVGQCFFDTDATAGSNLQVCTAADTWTTVSGSGGSGDITDVGDCSTGACFSGTTGNALQFEGSTADGFETTVTATDPTADRTITLPNATGTVALERVYDVRAYGAKCDDSTNDATAIQAAIDAAEAARSGVVQLPAGTCVIGSGLTMDANNVTLRGEGAGTSNRSTMLSCNITTGTCVTFGSSCTYCGVEDMAITARGTPTDLVLIDGTSASNDRVRNFTTSAGKYCTAIKNVQRVDHADLFGPVAGASCRGISVVDNAVYLHRVTGNWANDIEGMIVIEQTGTEIVDTVVISNTEIAQSGGAGAGLKFIGASTTNPPRWVQISNSLFEAKTTGATTGDYALYIDNVKEFKCTNCYFHGGYRAVVIDGGPGPIRFVNSEIGDSRREALYHNADVPTELIGTTVSDGGQETTNTYSGVYLSASSRQFTMIGGRASDDLFFSGSGQKYGIEIISGADEYRFDNVGCEGNDTACAVGLSTAATQAAFTDGTAYADSDWSNYVLVRAPSLAGNWTLTLPADDGNSGQFLQTDGSGTATWATPSGSGNVSNTGTPADNQVAVWTDATTIEGTSGLTFSAGTLTATTFSGALSGNASTATALASNPSDCAADTYATTIAASGNLTCASITNASTTGTALNTPSTLVLRDGSGNFAAGTITAALTGNASTATALAANPADCGSDTYATTIAASGALTCSTVTNAGLAGSIAMSKTLLTADAGLVLSTNSLATASAETGFVTGSTSLPGTCGEGAVYQDTDSGGTETYVCTASNTWTKLVAATDNVATATALASNPSDCGSDTYATTIAANGNLTCSTVSSAGIANGAIVNDDVNASAAIDVSKTALVAGAGLLLSTNTLATLSSEENFLTNGALTCGAGTRGKAQVHTTPLQYCDDAATPTLRYAAYGDSAGAATGLTCTTCVDGTDIATGAVSAAKVLDGSLTSGDMTETFISSYAGTGLTTDTTTSPDSLRIASTITATLTGDASGNTLLAGRAGTGNDTTISTDSTGTIYGSNDTSGSSLTLRATSANTTSGEIDLNAPTVELYPSLPSTTSSAQLLLKALPTTTLQTNDECTSASTPYACCSGLKAGTCAGAYTMVDSSPALSSTDFASIAHFRAGGSLARTGTTGATLYSVLGFLNDVEFTSATSGGPLFQDAFYDASRAEQTANTATQNTWVPISFLSKPELAATGTASLTVGNMYGIQMDPGFEETASAELVLDTYAGVNIADPRETSASAGAPAITNYIGVRVEDLADAIVTNPISVLSEGTTTEMRHAGPARFGATGAVTSGKKLDVQGDAIIKGYLDLGDDIVDPGAASTTSAIDISGSIDLPNSTGNFVGLKIAPTSAQSESNNLVGVDFSPTITQSGAVEIPVVYGLNIDGTSTVTGTTTFTSNALLRHNRTYTTATVDADPASGVIALSNTPGLSVSSASGTSGTTTLGAVLHSPQVTNSGGATYTVAVDYGLRMQGTYTESSGTMVVTDRVGLDFDDVTNTSSATAITRNIGVDIAALSTATTNIGIRNADTTVYTPGAAQTLNTTGSSITPSATMIVVTASGATGTLTSNPQVADGVDGQIIHIVYTNGATGSFTFADGNGLRLAGTMLMDDSNTLTLMYSSTIGDWVEIARALN